MAPPQHHPDAPRLLSFKELVCLRCRCMCEGKGEYLHDVHGGNVLVSPRSEGVGKRCLNENSIS